jgi:hypothetical protein
MIRLLKETGYEIRKIENVSLPRLGMDWRLRIVGLTADVLGGILNRRQEILIYASKS